MSCRFWTQTRWVRVRRWRRTWTSCTIVWRSTTPVTAALSWMTMTASSARQNPNSGRSSRGFLSPALRLRSGVSTVRGSSRETSLQP
uniref:Uncharacterized protein n=1 Tax=Seriola lalandi dorsalis TaxID=1841481 RepID=A0A3B4X905_SERLL